MADPLITDEQLAELLTTPQSASDDAGSMAMRPIKDVLDAIAFKEKRRSVKVHNVLSKMRAKARPGGTAEDC